MNRSLQGYLERVSDLGGEVSILRLLRMLRILKLTKSLPMLRAVVEAVIQGFTSVKWVVVLIGLNNYIFGCLGMILFKENV